MHESEVRRLQRSYQERDERLRPEDWKGNIYHTRHVIGQLLHSHTSSEIVRLLNEAEVELKGARILDVGCGHGGGLRHLHELGGEPHLLFGIDLFGARVAAAARANPAMQLAQADGGAIPFGSDAFDLVIQRFMFSSILDPGMHARAASEMLRVLRPGGLVLWLDLRIEVPGRLVGFSRRDAAALFPGSGEMAWRPVQPRYFRTLGPRAPRLAAALGQFIPWPNEAWLGLLRKGHDD